MFRLFILLFLILLLSTCITRNKYMTFDGEIIKKWGRKEKEYFFITPKPWVPGKTSVWPNEIKIEKRDSATWVTGGYMVNGKALYVTSKSKDCEPLLEKGILCCDFFLLAYESFYDQIKNEVLIEHYPRHVDLEKIINTSALGTGLVINEFEEITLNKKWEKERIFRIWINVPCSTGCNLIFTICLKNKTERENDPLDKFLKGSRLRWIKFECISEKI